MKFYYKLLPFLFLAFMVTACGGDSDGSDDDDEAVMLTVYPGEGVNDLRLNDSGSEIAETLGSNYSTIENSWGTGEAIYYMQYNNLNIQFFMGSSSEGADVETLRIGSIKFYGSFEGVTDSGIKIGSTLEEVKAAYGEGVEDFWGTVSYANEGIFFNFDDAELVEDFTVFEP